MASRKARPEETKETEEGGRGRRKYGEDEVEEDEDDDVEQGPVEETDGRITEDV